MKENLRVQTDRQRNERRQRTSTRQIILKDLSVGFNLSFESCQSWFCNLIAASEERLTKAVNNPARIFRKKKKREMWPRQIACLDHHWCVPTFMETHCNRAGRKVTGILLLKLFFAEWSGLVKVADPHKH